MVELDPLDTTVRVKFTLTAHPSLTTASALSTLLKPFGATDIDSIVLSLKSPKKDPSKPPKYGTALVPFKQIGDAFAAVCASGRADRGLGGIEVGWVNGKEPPILGWLKKMGKLGVPSPPRSKSPRQETKANLPQMQTTANASSFSSFPESFVCLIIIFRREVSLIVCLQPDINTPSMELKASAPGLSYESLTLMRLRQAERERLEREIREQEAD